MFGITEQQEEADQKPKKEHVNGAQHQVHVSVM